MPNVNRTPRVLIVEDEALISMELERRLAKLGYIIVGVCSTGERAITLVDELKPDLVLMDIRLRGKMDGIDAARIISPATPLIFLTAFADDATLERARTTEPIAFLLKPFSGQLLRATLAIAVSSLQIRQARDKAQKAERRAIDLRSAILDNTTDGILSIDDCGNIVQFNKGAEVMFGFTAEQIIGTPLDVLIPARHHPQHHQHVQCFRMAGPSSLNMAKRNLVEGQRKDGSAFPAAITLSSSVIDDELLITAIVRDQTELVKLENTVLRAKSLELVGRFSSSVAHDMNNVLAVIYNIASQLSYTSDLDEIRSLGDELLDAGRRGQALAQRLVPTNLKIHRNHRNALDLKAVLDDLTRLLKGVCGSRIRLVIEAAPDCVVEMDPVEFDQVVLNLVVNARDAIREGGEVRVSVQSKGDDVMLTVTDNGMGMTEDTILRCLEPFFSTKGAGRGTGLGLATVHDNIQVVGGTIKVTSRVGEGTSIRLLLPRSTKRPTVRPPAPSSTSQRTTDEVVLLVEDDDAVRTSTARLLRQHGFEVLPATGAGEALALVQARRGTIHVMLTDYQLPYMDGLELCRRVRRLRPRIRQLVITAQPNVATDELLENERVSILAKPFHISDLAIALEKTKFEWPSSKDVPC